MRFWVDLRNVLVAVAGLRGTVLGRSESSVSQLELRRLCITKVDLGNEGKNVRMRFWVDLRNVLVAVAGPRGTVLGQSESNVSQLELRKLCITKVDLGNEGNGDFVSSAARLPPAERSSPFPMAFPKPHFGNENFWMDAIARR